jgi:hypothetical protein
LRGAVGARHGLTSIDPLAGDRIITRVHADAERVAAPFDPPPLAARAVLTKHVAQATRTQSRTKDEILDLRRKVYAA